jgi:hypothetical protein
MPECRKKLRAGCPRSQLRSRFPSRHVLDLFGSERVDRNCERAQLKARDFLINFRWQKVHAGIEPAFVLHGIFDPVLFYFCECGRIRR